LVCPLSSGGFLYPAVAVALELYGRGHEVALFAGGPAARAAAGAGLEVLPAEAAGGAFAVESWFRSGQEQFRAVTEAARAVRPDVLVTSVLCPGALLAGEVLDVPVVVLGLAAHLWPYGEAFTDPEPARAAAGSRPDGSAGGGAEEALGAADAEDRRWRLAETVRHHQALRERLGLALPSPAQAARHLLGRAFLLRGHPVMEPPGAVLPEGVRHVGPLWWEPPDDGRSLQGDAGVRKAVRPSGPTGADVVYVHLGRTFGGRSLWPWIETAFPDGGGRRAVVELARTPDHRPAPGTAVLAVRRPRMGDLLGEADAVVANGTSAPVLGALLHGLPLLLRPNGGEQRVLAAACVRAGVAVELPAASPGERVPEGPSPARVLSRALDRPGLRERARAVGADLARAKSVLLAAQEVEEAAR